MPVRYKSVIYNRKYIADTACISERGGRIVNEDSVLYILKEKKMLFAVADGLGAHGGGDTASHTAVNTAENMFINNSYKMSPRGICRLYSMINKSIYQKHTDEIRMKTTFACLETRKDKLCISNLGDTRIYCFYNNKLEEMTADHSVSYEEVMKNGGDLNDVRNHPQRHILNAALGVEKSRCPDIYMRRLKEGQAFLICSDGFWEYVYEDEMIDRLRYSKNAKTWLSGMMKLHQRRAEEYHDNYSAIAIIIKRKKEDEICSTKA